MSKGFVSQVPLPELAKPLKRLKEAKGQTLVEISDPYGDCVVLNFTDCLVVLRAEGEDDYATIKESQRIDPHDLAELQEAGGITYQQHQHYRDALRVEANERAIDAERELYLELKKKFEGT